MPEVSPAAGAVAATPAARAAARAFVNGAVDLHLDDLTAALHAAYGDAYTTGLLVSAQQTGANVVAGLGQTSLPTSPADWAAFWDAWTPGNQPAADLLTDGGLADLLAQTDTTISGIEGTTLDRLGNLLADGVANGDSVDTIAATLGDFLDSPARAYQIADTETARATSNAAMNGYEQAGVREVDWLVSPGACPECQDYADAGPYTLGNAPGQPAHPSCFPAGTVTTGPQVVGSTERWYEGELVEIVTAAGHFLAVTPNHPILTPDGFVPAGELNVGGDVVSCRDAQRTASVIDPNHYHGPASIEDVAVTLGRASLVATISMPTSAVDFHGDGIGSEVHVVRTDGLLRDDSHHLALTQPLANKQLDGRRVGASPLSGGGRLDLLLEGDGASETGLMGSTGKPPALVGAGLGHSGVHAGAPVANFHTSLSEHSPERWARDAVALRERFQGGPSQVVVDQPVRSGQEPSVAADTASSQGSTEHGAPDAGLLDDLLHRCPSDVHGDRIVELSRRDFAGHVYNLQTVAGWYTANGIVVHNCRCSYSPRDPGPSPAGDSGE